jgi:hypothetical protein
MPDTVSDLASRLAANAEAVCRHYLPNGKRAGAYWCVGDVHGAPGRSLYVRLRGPLSGKGAAGRWTDAATGERGDLLDLIRAAQSLSGLADALEEARRFLDRTRTSAEHPALSPTDASYAARRLWNTARAIAGTVAEAYFRARGIQLGPTEGGALRFHPRCFYRSDDRDPVGMPDAWPALLAAVTGWDGKMTGLQRIWLDPARATKAPVGSPRRALGHLLGKAVRFGAVDDVMTAGEGIETVLSLRSALPSLPLAAALSASNLASLLPPPGLRRLYIARDNDEVGRWAVDRLTSRMAQAGIEVIVLVPHLGDFNDDLREFGHAAVATLVRDQLIPEDIARFCRARERP